MSSGTLHATRPRSDPDALTTIGRIDGAAVTVDIPGDITSAPEAVLLSIQSGSCEDPPVARLHPEEARRLADQLMKAADAAPGEVGVEPTRVAPRRHAVIAAEGMTAGDLRRALDAVPADSPLRDFVSDAEVVLVFDAEPGQRRPTPPTLRQASSSARSTTQ